MGGGKGKEWPHANNRKCSNIGNRVSYYMDTLGSALLHEYTHAPDLVQPPLEETTNDPAYGFYNARNLANKDLAKSNADSYALFASELTWTLICNRAFDPPVKDNSPDKATDNKGSDTKGSSSKGSSNKGSSSKGSSSKGSSGKGSSGKGSSSKGSSGKGSSSKGTTKGTKRQTPRLETQSASLLHKRTAFSQPYQHPIPKTNVDNTYTVEQMDQFLEGHIDALQLCRVAIKQSTKNPTRFDKVFREYFDPNDRALVISKSLPRWEQDRSVEGR
jgi:hypothetical protein